MIVIGIDPGLCGAIAVLSPEGRVLELLDTPILSIGKRREHDGAAMARALLPYADGRAARVAIEQVHAMPKQGVTSMFSFGQGFGTWLGIIAALGLPLERVTPQAWKREMLAGRPKEKGASRQRAIELFPGAPLQLAKHHGRADALLIAAFARRHLVGGVGISTANEY